MKQVNRLACLVVMEERGGFNKAGYMASKWSLSGGQGSNVAKQGQYSPEIAIPANFSSSKFSCSGRTDRQTCQGTHPFIESQATDNDTQTDNFRQTVTETHACTMHFLPWAAKMRLTINQQMCNLGLLFVFRSMPIYWSLRLRDITNTENNELSRPIYLFPHPILVPASGEAVAMYSMIGGKYVSYDLYRVRVNYIIFNQEFSRWNNFCHETEDRVQ